MNIRRQAGLKQYDENKASITHLFDIKTLDLYCRYVISMNANIRMSSLSLVNNLFNKVHIEDYGNDKERINRIRFIKKGLEARASKHLKEKDLIIKHINGGLLNDDLLDTSYFAEISDDELAFINEQSSVLSQYYFVDSMFADITKLSAELESSTGLNKSNTVLKIKELVSSMNSAFNRVEAATNMEPEFDLRGDEFENTLRDIYSKETNSSRTLRTGVSGLNRMINGGYESGRVYIYFGTAATGKSFFAIDTALQIMKYNNNYKTKDPTKKPCVVFLTMENSVQENISRMFNMITGQPLGSCASFDEALHKFQDAMDMYTNGNNVDIHMEYQPNLSKNTDYLYTLADKVKAMNREPICMIVDHIKRIRPVEGSRDLRLDLGNIVNEFKAFANRLDIPVISISHLNREAAKNIGESKNKKDIIRTLGVQNVSDSLLMVDNCDVGIILNKEEDSNKNIYMGFSAIKTRTRCDVGLFFQPFLKEYSLKLMEDCNDPVPVFKWTLQDDKVSSLKRYGSDYVVRDNKRNRDEDDELFSSKDIQMVEEPDIDSIDNILKPFNENQDQFIMTGEPSQPIYPITSVDITPLPVAQDLTEWEKHLIYLKYNDSNMKNCIFITDEDGMTINDGVEDIIRSA